jgi:hypothetical protein
LLEPVHAPLDHVAPPIGFSIETGSASRTPGASLFLVLALGDGMGDAAPAEQYPTPLEAVGPVGEQVGGPLAGPAGCALRTRYAHRVEQFLELCAAVALTGREHHRKRATFAITGEVDLGGKASPAASQSLVFGV